MLLATCCLLATIVLLACRPSGPEKSSVTEPTEGQPATVSVSLAWDPPTTDAAGRPLDDLAGYRLYFGTRSPLSQARDTSVELSSMTSFTLEDLPPGTYFFAISAVDDSGNESELSNEVRAELTGP